MKKNILLLFSIIILVHSLHAVDVGVAGDDNCKIMLKASNTPVEVNENISTLVPTIKLELHFPFTDKIRFMISGEFYNEANFQSFQDDNSGDNIKTYNWSAIKDRIELNLGWKYVEAMQFGFMLGGGVDYNAIYKEENIAATQTTTATNGFGPFVSTGFGIKFTSPFFFDNLNHIFIYQNFLFAPYGNGSVGIESFIFGSSIAGDFSNISTSYNWNHNKDNRFQFFQFQTDSKFAISIPLQRHVNAFSVLDNLELKFEPEYLYLCRYYYNYEYNNAGTLQIYNITSSQRVTAALLMSVIFRPINEIEIVAGYRPNYEMPFVEWSDYNKVNYKWYQFTITHEFELSALFRFPPEESFRFKLGVKYLMKQFYTYEYMSDGNYTKEIIFSTTVGNSPNNTTYYSLLYYINFITEFNFKLYRKRNLTFTLNVFWEPRIILYDPSNTKTKINFGNSQYILDTNILNLALWRIEIEISFDPNRIG